jgi:hypothetical protein
VLLAIDDAEAVAGEFELTLTSGTGHHDRIVVFDLLGHGERVVSSASS